MTVRIGWGEPDWFGPGAATAARRRAPPPRRRPGPTTSARPGRSSWPTAPIRCSVRAYPDRPMLVFRSEATTDLTDLAAGAFDQPSVGWPVFNPSATASPGGLPEGSAARSGSSTPSSPCRRAGPDLDDWFLLDFRPPVVEPMLLIAPDLRTVLLAPLDSFHDQVIAPPTASGRRPLRLARRPRRGARRILHRSVVGAATGRGASNGGPTAAHRAGTVRPGPRADVLGRQLSYWTDNGAAYWYRTEPPRDVTATVVDAVEALRDQGVGVGAVQLDSWFYPHDELRPFDTDEWEVPPSGAGPWEARDDVLPDGVPALRAALGDPPLVAHIRHLAASSPYTELFECWTDGDRAHPSMPTTTPRWPTRPRRGASRCSSTTGWSSASSAWRACAPLPVEHGRGRRVSTGWPRERGMTLQWCMASPADLMQTVSLSQVTSVRTSGDHGYLVTPGILWTWFCYVNTMARALGLWPFKDVFRTDGTDLRRGDDGGAAVRALRWTRRPR